MGDLNINWMSRDCPLKSELLNVTNASDLSQVINQPTRIFINSSGKRTSTCIDHIFTNAADLCFKGISAPIGWTDHNIIAITRKAKVPKGRPKVIYKRSCKRFCQESFCTNVYDLCWSDVFKQVHPDNAIRAFENIFYPVVDKHAPIKKHTVRNVKVPWIDNDLKSIMADRNVAKRIANRMGSKDDWETYSNLRNQVTKINRKKKKMFFKLRINKCKYDGKNHGVP